MTKKSYLRLSNRDRQIMDILYRDDDLGVDSGSAVVTRRLPRSSDKAASAASDVMPRSRSA